MDKIEKRTAEEILESTAGHSIDAMRQYAAQELDAYKAVIKELIPIAERHVYLHGNDDSVVDRKSIIERARKLIKL